jgi:hypothetical protein
VICRFSLTALLLLGLLSAIERPLHAQMAESALSDAEVEKLRDTAYDPPQRVLAFIVMLDDRTKSIDKLMAGKRMPGREQDIHEQMEQFSSIANDLLDNLDEYSHRHRDIRKALPKLSAAIERWGTSLKTPPDDQAYDVSRKLALESLGDLRDTTTQMTEEQKAYFKDHPPAKEPNGKPGVE